MLDGLDTYQLWDVLTVAAGAELTILPAIILRSTDDDWDIRVSGRLEMNGAYLELTGLNGSDYTTLYVHDGGEAVLTGCAISDSRARLHVYNGADLVLNGCTFSGGWVTYSAGSSGSVDGCDGTSWHLVASAESLLWVHYNDLAFATVSVNGDSSATCDLTYNWWGTTEPGVIEGKVYHCVDNPSLPCVDFEPWLPGPPPEPEAFLGQLLLAGHSADPVNTATGNFTHEEVDLSIAARGMPLEEKRFYNSKDTRESPLGPGWTHSYHIVLDVNAPNDQVSVRWGDGRTDYWVEDDGSYRPSVPNLFDELTDNGDGTWTVIKRSLDRYDFDASGRLMAITDKNGNAITLGYNDPERCPTSSTEVTDPAGRTITLDLQHSTACWRR